MNIRLAADLQTDSIVDGPGLRAVIWTQGCSHNCPGCQNPTTHDFNGGELIDLDYNYKIGLIDLNVGLESILCRYCS